MEPYDLVDPKSVRQALQSFSPEVRRKGEELQRRGAVTDWEIVDPGAAYSAMVLDKKVFAVEVFSEVYGPGELDWMGDCDCATEFECEHIYAVLKELLAQKASAVVQSLSASLSGPAPKPKSVPKPPVGLKSLLSEAVKRPLTKAEERYLRQVLGVYQRCRLYRTISPWDFQELGMELHSSPYSAQSAQIWPSFPATEHEFWLHVALTAEENGVAIPDFMLPITDLTEVRRRIVSWRRECEVERWRVTLRRHAEHAEVQRPSEKGDTDLRLAIGRDAASVHWKRPGATEFEPLKASQLRSLRSAWENGDAPLTLEAESLWEALSPVLEYSQEFDWKSMSPEKLAVIARALRFPALQSRVVTSTGEPLARPPEALRWELTPAASEEDDYRMRLVQADGSPVPPILTVLPGSPSLYLTPTALYIGPRMSAEILDPSDENRIPAPALETEAGVELIKQLGLDTPPRLKERIRELPYTIYIHCELRPSWNGSNSEDCAVQVRAEAPDGHALKWTGYNWLDDTSNTAKRAARSNQFITRYDSAKLATARALLEPLQLKVGSAGNALVTRVTRKFPDVFASWLKSLPPDYKVQLGGELASLADGTVAGQVKLDVTEAEIDWFDLRVVLDVSDATLSKEEIQLLLKAKGSFVRLPGKGWRRLQFNLTEEEDERLARLGLSARELSAEPQRLHALQLADDAAKSFLPAQQVEAVQRRASELRARVTPELPAGLQASLRPYQLEGYHFLAYLATNRFGGILADDMGLGKTVQTLAWLLWIRSAAAGESAPGSRPPAEPGTPRQPVLVICPKSVMDNWRAEAARFAPELRVKAWSPSQLDSFRDQLATADVHVLNYNQLRTLGETLVAVRWQAVILDEGQYIKNPSSQTAQVARALHANHRLVLSGTPIENRLLDLWSLMAFVMPGVLGSRAQFSKLYEPKGDPFARRRLASRVRPFLLRRTKGQVAKDLPDRIEEDLFCEMEGEQKALYRAELKRAQQLLLGVKTQKELAQQQFHFLVSLLRLRQICCHPRLHDPQSTAPSAKSEALLEQLEPLMEEGQKVLVFSQFVELLNVLRPTLEERAWPIFYLAGDTENRGELVNKFQSAPGPAVFLISLKAGGFGLNLTAASYVVLFDPWWNPAVENQAIDRTHRIGQMNKVIAYRLLIKDSIEEKIRELQKQKNALAQDVLGEERFGQGLTIDDLRFLFAD